MDERLREARAHARAGRYVEAVRLFEELMRDGKDADLGVQIELGFARLLAGDVAGARRLRERVAEALEAGRRLAEELRPLWSRFCELVEGVARHVVVGSVAATMLAGCAPSGQAPAAKGGPAPAESEVMAKRPPAGMRPGFSAHRYSAGVRIDFDELRPVAPSKPTTRPTTSAASTAKTTSTTAGAVTTAGDLDELEGQAKPWPGVRPPRPGFSAHRYSAGVRIDIRDFDPDAKAKPPRDEDALIDPGLRPKPGFSAHRYSAGVRFDPSRLLRKSKSPNPNESADDE